MTLNNTSDKILLSARAHSAHHPIVGMSPSVFPSFVRSLLGGWPLPWLTTLQVCSDQVLGPCLSGVLDQEYNLVIQELLEMERERFLHPDPTMPADFPKMFIYRSQQFPFCAPRLIGVFVTCNRKHSRYANIILITTGTRNSKGIWLYPRCSDFHRVTWVEAVPPRFSLALVTFVTTKQTNPLASHRDTFLYTPELSRKLDPVQDNYWQKFSKLIIIGPQCRDPHHEGGS